MEWGRRGGEGGQRTAQLSPQRRLTTQLGTTGTATGPCVTKVARVSPTRKAALTSTRACTVHVLEPRSASSQQPICSGSKITDFAVGGRASHVVAVGNDEVVFKVFDLQASHLHAPRPRDTHLAEQRRATVSAGVPVSVCVRVCGSGARRAVGQQT